MTLIAPSILAADFANLEAACRLVEEAGADWLHLDVMDGHFVPNLTFGPPLIRALRPVTNLPFDVHLMVKNPGDYVEELAEIGCERITFHVEVAADHGTLLERIRTLNIKAGLALNPETPLAAITPYFEQLDQVLVMTASPGFSGQAYQRQRDKLQALRSHFGPEFPLIVDCGISMKTIRSAAENGANVFVASSAIYKAENPALALAELRTAALLS